MPSRSRPQQVCSYCSNLTGCIVIACLFGVGRIIYATVLWWLLWSNLHKERVFNIFVVSETYLGLSLIADILLIIGSIKKIKGLFDPWMVFAVIGIILSVLGSFFNILNAIQNTKWIHRGSFPFTPVIGTIIGLAMFGQCVLCLEASKKSILKLQITWKSN